MVADIRRRAWSWYGGFLLAPLLLLQGLWVRSRTPRLADAAGPCFGHERYAESPDSSDMALVFIGESPVAGVGVASLDEAMASQTSILLKEKRRCTVAWRSRGETGSVASQWDHWLAAGSVPDIEGAEIVVVVLGVNDTTGLTSRSAWRNALAGIIQSLSLGTAHTVIFTAVPPVQQFTALSRPLCWWLGLRSAMLEQDLAQVIQSEQYRYPGLRLSHFCKVPDVAPEMLADDGFHPSAKGYRHWAGLLAGHISEIFPAE